jgi:hypothetical protein
MHQPNFENGKGLWTMTPNKSPRDNSKKLSWIFSRNIPWCTLIKLFEQIKIQPKHVQIGHGKQIFGGSKWFP